jgi:hypothetical protein
MQDDRLGLWCTSRLPSVPRRLHGARGSCGSLQLASHKQGPSDTVVNNLAEKWIQTPIAARVRWEGVLGVSVLLNRERDGPFGRHHSPTTTFVKITHWECESSSVLGVIYCISVIIRRENAHICCKFKILIIFCERVRETDSLIRTEM